MLKIIIITAVLLLLCFALAPVAIKAGAAISRAFKDLWE